MNIALQSGITPKNVTITITGSKSESNRLLLLQALYPEITIDNLSNSDDTVVLQKALVTSASIIDIHHAGTAMRFLTAYLAIKKGTITTLTGSKRMQERPIKILVDALREMGAEIVYEKQEGYPPLKITGKTLDATKVTIQANVSSQYISALLLIAPSLKKGLTISLEGKITSTPYIKMTLSLLDQIGVRTTFIDNKIRVEPLRNALKQIILVEADWSSASYFYSIVALNKETTVTLKGYKKNSLQGDAALVEIYKQLGVHTIFNTIDASIEISKKTHHKNHIELDLSNTPDIAQTIAVTCFGLGISCNLKGLHTLKIKETDRLVALQCELTKLGAKVTIAEDSLFLESTSQITNNVAIDTYEDHRMAMAFAPLASLIPITINNAQVVSKSYPEFWNDIASLGIAINHLSK